MLESFNTTNGMQYERLTEEEKQRRGILGRLVGIIADFKNATRNGRRYTEELWDKTFDDPIVKEKIDNRCVLGELGHPADRQETDIEKVAICLAEVPKKGNDGKLYGVFDILDTPNGRILKTLCDYGCNIGVSSRGGGDTFEDFDGNETVDPSSYEFESFDAVLLPAVEAARPTYVTESFNIHNKNLKTALLEAMQNSTEDEQKVMKNTLDELNINYSDGNDTLEESYYGARYTDANNEKHKIIFKCEGTIEDAEDLLDDVIPVPYIKATLLGSMPLELAQKDGFELVEKLSNPPEKVDNINVITDDLAAVNDGADMISELQESFKRQQELEAQVKSLQEKLSVCYTKESRYSDRLGKANSKSSAQEIELKKLSEQIENLTLENKQISDVKQNLEQEVKTLSKNLDNKLEEIRSLTESLSGYRTRYSDMNKKLSESESNKTKLDESLTTKSAKIKELTEAYTSLKESTSKQIEEFRGIKESLEQKSKKLLEEVQEVKKDNQILKSQNNAKLEKAQQLVEKYKAIAKTAVDNYISSQATRIGVSATDVKSRLNESYSFKDIDKAIEDLQQYKIDLHSLPFNTLTSKKSVKANIRESKEPLLSFKDDSSYKFDDDIDETLLTFTN